MISFNCSSCGKLLQIGDEWAGKLGNCPYCHTNSPVPGPQQQQTDPNLIGFVCCGCGAQLTIGKEWAGKLGNCPHCHANSRVPGYPKRTPRSKVIARFVAYPVAVLAFWAIMFNLTGLGGWTWIFLASGLGALAVVVFVFWVLMNLIMWIIDPQGMKVWKAGGGDPFFDTLPAPFNNDPNSVRYQELYREKLRQETQPNTTVLPSRPPT